MNKKGQTLILCGTYSVCSEKYLDPGSKILEHFNLLIHVKHEIHL